METLKENKQKHNDETSVLRKVVKTIFLFLTWVALGLFLEIQGPTFKDLEIQTGASTEAISRAISGRSAGYFIGSFIGGFLVDKFTRYCDLMIALCLDGGAIATVIAPWSPNSVLLWILFTLQGTFEGVINIAGQKLILLIWKKKASSPLHALHLGFGVGSFIVPNIANPFLAVPDTSLIHNVSNTTLHFSQLPKKGGHVKGGYVNFTTDIAMNRSQPLLLEPVLYLRESRIDIAYMIVAVLTVLLSLVFYGYQFLHRNSNLTKKIPNFERKSLRHILDPATCAPGNRIFGIKLFVLLFFFYANAVGGERILGKFVRNYSIDQLGFSVDQGSVINTFFWISFAIGRFSGFLIARWIPIRILLPIEAVGALIASILLNIFARDNATTYWVFILLVGFFEAPMFPTAMGWADTYLEMTGSAITFLLLGGASGGVAYMFIIGYFYDNYGNFSFLYQVLAFGVIAILLAFLLTLVGWGHGNRYDVAKTGSTEGEFKDEQEKERLRNEDFQGNDMEKDDNIL